MVQKKPIQIHAAMQQQTIKRGDRHTMQARTKNDLQNLHAICCFPKTSKCAAETQPRWTSFAATPSWAAQKVQAIMCSLASQSHAVKQSHGNHPLLVWIACGEQTTNEIIETCSTLRELLPSLLLREYEPKKRTSHMVHFETTVGLRRFYNHYSEK